MLNAVNAVMDTHLLTPVGSSAYPAARSESPVKRYLGAGKYRLYPFDSPSQALLRRGLRAPERGIVRLQFRQQRRLA